MSGTAGFFPYLDGAFPPDALPAHLGVAVSGGSDSLGLLHLLHDWGRVPLTVLTVDHGLRAESPAETALVAEIAARLDLRHVVLRWRGWDGTGNLQDQARRARYRLLSDWAAGTGVGDIALGHTLDDQAETLLLGLSRGAGLDGLSGMRPVFRRGGVRFHRPLLALHRQALRDDLAARGVAWAEDPSNRDDRFDRVRARQALAALAPLGVDADTLGRSIANLRNTRTAIAVHLAHWAQNHVTPDRGDLCIDPKAFRALPDDFARRLLGAALRWIARADYPPRAEPVMRLIRSPGPEPSTLHGCLIATGRDTLRIGREPQAAKRAAPVGTARIWDNRWCLSGPHEAGLQIRATGEAGLAHCPDWRDARLPRSTLLAAPSIWRGDRFVAAPLAGVANGWRADLAQSVADFPQSLISH